MHISKSLEYNTTKSWASYSNHITATINLSEDIMTESCSLYAQWISNLAYVGMFISIRRRQELTGISHFLILIQIPDQDVNAVPLALIYSYIN